MSTGNGNGNGPSHLDWLRERHEALKADRVYDLAVPGYSGRLVLRCGPVPWSAMAKAAPAAAEFGGTKDPDGRATLYASADLLIAAVRDVLVREDEYGELTPIDPSGPRRMDPELAALLGSGTDTARELVMWLFPSEVAVFVAGGEVADWTREADTETTEAVAGE